MDVKIPFGHDKIMIDFNDIKCALKGNDATNNIMNIFFCYILKGVPKIHGVHQCNNHEHIYWKVFENKQEMKHSRLMKWNNCIN